MALGKKVYGVGNGCRVVEYSERIGADAVAFFCESSPYLRGKARAQRQDARVPDYPFRPSFHFNSCPVAISLHLENIKK